MTIESGHLLRLLVISTAILGGVMSVFASFLQKKEVSGKKSTRYVLSVISYMLTSISILLFAVQGLLFS